MMNADSVEQLLIRCAIEQRSITYSEALAAFGMRFTRPKLRELCQILGEVNRMAADRGEPELAVLVVRSSDRLPGDGWWASRNRYRGEWTGVHAERYVSAKQKEAFHYWQRENPILEQP